jgi:hypothetical protein
MCPLFIVSEPTKGQNTPGTSSEEMKYVNEECSAEKSEIEVIRGCPLLKMMYDTK